MRRFSYVLAFCLSLFFAGCFETTQEITLNDDGSGVVTNKNDMSSMLGMAGQMGGGEKLDKIKDMDSTILFSTMVDSIKDLNPAEKKLISKGKMRIFLNKKSEKFYTLMTFPFKNAEEFRSIQQALPKLGEEAAKKATGKMEMPAGMDESDMPKAKTFDDYFDLTMTKNSITKTLNKAKYATAADDQYMKMLQQMGSMGAPATANYVFNLPRPATKVEGKGLKLSADKKQVTLKVTSDDFFDEPNKFEYKIEY